MLFEMRVFRQVILLLNTANFLDDIGFEIVNAYSPLSIVLPKGHESFIELLSQTLVLQTTRSLIFFLVLKALFQCVTGRCVGGYGLHGVCLEPLLLNLSSYLTPVQPP